jgi:hypothetical protein
MNSLLFYFAAFLIFKAELCRINAVNPLHSPCGFFDFQSGALQDQRS